MSLPDRLLHWFVGVVATQVGEALAERRAGAEALIAASEGLSAALGDASSALRSLEDGVEVRQPFSGTTTVHRAWARHPGVRGVFARYHLSACPDCPVGADETLEEAALGYQIPLSTLLEQLNALP